MVDIEQKIKAFEKELAKLDKKIFTTVNELLKQGKSKEMILGIVEGSFDDMIQGLGVEALATAFAEDLVIHSVDYATDLKAISNELRNAIVTNTSELSTTYRDEIMGYFNANTSKLKAELTNSLISGVPTSEITKSLQQKFTRVSDGTTHLLNDANINTVVQTSYSNVSRMSTITAFQDTPEQRFSYEGGVISTSSDQCKWLSEFQKPEGYTLEEINNGITTPYGVIDWFGRRPNYNCIHQWMPADDYEPVYSGENPNNKTLNKSEDNTKNTK